MYKYSPTISDLMVLCENYINDCNDDHNYPANEKIYDSCFAYFGDYITKKQKNELTTFFKIQL
jgi:spore cortex formation protein SpoVR/YcgB (stage V sporulation)